MKRRTFALVLSLAAAPLAGIQAERESATTAILVETVEVIFDGKKDGLVTAGTAVIIIGEKKDEGLSLVRFKSAEGNEKK